MIRYEIAKKINLAVQLPLSGACLGLSFNATGDFGNGFGGGLGSSTLIAAWNASLRLSSKATIVT